MSVVKKRSGLHEMTIREMRMGPGGVEIGEPLERFQGVLSGIPTFVGGSEGLLSGMPAGQEGPTGGRDGI